MGVVYIFTCDGCGMTGSGVLGQYVHPEPPMGWRWRFGAPLEGPHACSRECWVRFARTDDGKIVLYDDHEKRETRHAPVMAVPLPAIHQNSLPESPQEVAWAARKTVTYLIQRGEDGPVKIGKSKDVAKRLRSLQTGTPEPLRLLCTTDEAEEVLHERFRALRLQGEWFRPAPELLAYVAGRAA